MSRAFALSALLTVSCVFVLPSAVAEEAAKGASKADVTKGGAIAAAVCAACHAADGNAIGATFPKLAGQHAAYLANELHNFKVQPGATQPTRYNAIMNGYAAALSDTDIQNVSAY